MEDLIKRLKEQVDIAVYYNYDMESISYHFEEGTIISYNEAQQIIEHYKELNNLKSMLIDLVNKKDITLLLDKVKSHLLINYNT